MFCEAQIFSSKITQNLEFEIRQKIFAKNKEWAKFRRYTELCQLIRYVLAIFFL